MKIQEQIIEKSFIMHSDLQTEVYHKSDNYPENQNRNQNIPEELSDRKENKSMISSSCMSLVASGTRMPKPTWGACKIPDVKNFCWLVKMKYSSNGQYIVYVCVREREGLA